ncbi:hypothetical protein F5883DRAFT_604994 [Diaporthe sp. PMI_573]|nr:hypothetical protein F5883DRAFT_604994 [Diaporthaceae sp. PMI_573]
MWPPIDYDLDVEGDVILTLENPNEPFAVWVDEGEPWEQRLANPSGSVWKPLSLKHLISASPYFRRMLTGPWKENASRADRLYKVTASDWSEDAFKLLMDIVHGNSQNVPRSINLELLAKIAVMVDYYKCYDVVKFYSDTWIEGLGNAMKVTNYSRDLRLAIRQIQEPLRSLGLPFPDGLIGLWPCEPACRCVC